MCPARCLHRSTTCRLLIPPGWGAVPLGLGFLLLEAGCFLLQVFACLLCACLLLMTPRMLLFAFLYVKKHHVKARGAPTLLGSLAIFDSPALLTGQRRLRRQLCVTAFRQALQEPLSHHLLSSCPLAVPGHSLRSAHSALNPPLKQCFNHTMQFLCLLQCLFALAAAGAVPGKRRTSAASQSPQYGAQEHMVGQLCR